VARWLSDAGVTSAFQVGYANGRYLFYLSRLGIACGGTDLPARETEWTAIPKGALDAPVTGRLLEVDFFDLTPSQVSAGCGAARQQPLDVLFTEATFETMLPWRTTGVSVPKYAAMSRKRSTNCCRRSCRRSSPSSSAACAASSHRSSRGWRRRPRVRVVRQAIARLFLRRVAISSSVRSALRLSASSHTQQVVYAYIQDRRLTDVHGAYAERMT
jgi:hypothetical protein